MKPLLLIGAGGCGREVAAMLRHTNNVQPRWEILGFLDDSAALQGQLIDGHRVLGGVGALGNYRDAYCACCVADPIVRMKVVQRANRFGVRWATLMHHSSIVMDTAMIEEGCILLPFSAVTTNAHLGKHVQVNYHSSIGHDGRLGDYVTLSSFVDITGKVTLGMGVFVGSGASVLPGMTVGEHAIVGGGALVHRDVPARTVAVGVPARVIRERNIDVPMEDPIGEGTVPAFLQSNDRDRCSPQGDA